MAGYPRDIVSIEQALRSIIKDLKEDKIKEVTNKTESWFRKCSDPHIADKNIDHQDSINLDIASLKEGKGTPLLQAHNSQVKKAMAGLKKSQKIENTLMEIGTGVGNLMEVIKEATSPKSRAGEEIDVYEKEQIYDSIKKIEDKISELKITLADEK